MTPHVKNKTPQFPFVGSICFLLYNEYNKPCGSVGLWLINNSSMVVVNVHKHRRKQFTWPIKSDGTTTISFLLSILALILCSVQYVAPKAPSDQLIVGRDPPPNPPSTRQRQKGWRGSAQHPLPHPVIFSLF